MDEKDSENGISDIQKMEMVIQKMDTPTGLSYLFNFTLDKTDKWKIYKEMEMMENEMRKKEKEFTKMKLKFDKQIKLQTDKAPISSRVNFTLAAFVAGGAIAKYVKAKSMPSLIGGFGLSALYAGSGVLINNGSGTNGHLLALFTSVGLVGDMGPKVIKFVGKPMPTTLAVVGALAAYYNFNMYKFWLIDETMASRSKNLMEKMAKSKHKIVKQRNSNEDTLKLLESIRRRSIDDGDQFDQTRIFDNNNNDNENKIKNE